MPNLFDYEYGELGQQSTDDIWAQWSQGTLADDWTYQTPVASAGYDAYGIPIQIDPITGNPISYGQQFIPEGLSFSGYNTAEDMYGQEGYQSVDWGSYASPTDQLSGLTQEELAQVLGEYGFEYLNNIYGSLSDEDQAAFDAAGGAAGLGALFAEQYGSSLPSWDSTGLDLQAAIAASDEASMWAAYSDWENSQIC